MSSFVGHSLTAVTLYAATRPKKPLIQREIGWFAWLIIVANVPDIDYVITSLSTTNHGIRLTFGSTLLLPLLTIVILLAREIGERQLKLFTLQITLAGLSHTILDGLVGVTFLPFLWPLSSHQYRLPFGILPSAGTPSLTNYYFFHNLLIEMGVMLPLYYAILLRQKTIPSRQSKATMLALLLCSAGFMYWALTLAR